MFPVLLQNVIFTPNGRPVLKGVDLTLDSEGVTAVLGPNGAGKSVLLRVIAGLERPHGGAIGWGGGPEPKERIAFMFQRPMLLRASVAANVALSLKPLNFSRESMRAKVREMLGRVGLADRAGDSARHLSGGERQRLALARAWIVRPRLMLLDEPTAALDPTATEAVERLIREIRTEGTRIVMSTHNLGQAQRLSDDIVFIAEGQVREQSPSARFFAKPRSAEARLFIHGELPWRISFER
jgi:tungstate transport system ATP-binding protein